MNTPTGPRPAQVITDLLATSERYGASTRRYDAGEMGRFFTPAERDQLGRGEVVVREKAGFHGRLEWRLAA